MRFPLYLLFLSTSLGANAAEQYAISEGPAAALAAFSRAANQAPLQAKDNSSVRVWNRDYMLGRVQGLVLSGNSALICSMTSTYENGVVSLGQARCRPTRVRVNAAREIRGLSDFSRPEWDCPLMDGGEVFIERVRSGNISAVRVGNPDACEDPESRAIAAVLSSLW